MLKPPRSIVIGTAGHIDHGKTTLVRALTGVDTDRLPEEKRRGITIDLGFASFEAVSQDNARLQISFVDVPGHSLFIRNMLAGAGCVQAAMLVVAADEGIMPQTVEHLAICQLLGISYGLTVITKADTVSVSRLQEVMQTVNSFLQGTFLDPVRSPVVRVSAATGYGVDELRAELIKLAGRVQVNASEALLRLPVDRSFVMKGFGTVVTGTLLSGNIRYGQSLQLQPVGRMVRVRGLQTHGKPVESVEPGSRVALNLSGAVASEIKRGATLITPDALPSVSLADVEVSLLHSAPQVKHRVEVHFHAFTSETMATISLLGGNAAQPGTVRLMRIKFAEPIVLVPGDRFILRLPYPAGTIGGGRVLDTYPEQRQKRVATLAWLELLQKASAAEQVALRIKRRGVAAVNIHALCRETGKTSQAIRNDLEASVRDGSVLLVPEDSFLSREGLAQAVSAITARLKAGHSQKASELRNQTGLSSLVFDFAMNLLVRERKIEIRGETISTIGHGRMPSSDESKQVEKIAYAYKEYGLASPSVDAMGKMFGIDEIKMRTIITALLRSKTIVRMGSDDLFIHSEALQLLIARLGKLRGKTIDVAGFKELTGLSRKYAIPLLEYLDRQRVTRKDGDRRLIL